jgi:hypothetical protein
MSLALSTRSSAGYAVGDLRAGKLMTTGMLLRATALGAAYLRLISPADYRSNCTVLYDGASFSLLGLNFSEKRLF